MGIVYFWSAVWLVGAALAPVLIYWIVIRPKAKLTETAADDSFWPWFKEILKRFRTLWIGAIGTLITVLPDALQVLVGLDYQCLGKDAAGACWGLPAPWSIFAGPATSILLVLVRAMATTSPGETPSAEG